MLQTQCGAQVHDPEIKSPVLYRLSQSGTPQTHSYKSPKLPLEPDKCFLFELLDQKGQKSPFLKVAVDTSFRIIWRVYHHAAPQVLTCPGASVGNVHFSKLPRFVLACFGIMIRMMLMTMVAPRRRVMCARHQGFWCIPREGKPQGA